MLSVAVYQISPECGAVKQPLIMPTDSVGQEFGQGFMGMACPCSMMSRAAAGRLKGWGLESSKGSLTH